MRDNVLDAAAADIVTAQTHTVACADKPLRLAVYGYLNRDSGSGPASHYLVLREVLRKGHSVDLYAIATFIEPQDLADFPTLHYFPVAVPWADWILHKFLLKLPAAVGWMPSSLFNQFRHWLYYRRIEKLMRAKHSAQPYDALLVLDIISPFRVMHDLPCLNCPPGSPLGELEGLQNSKDAFIRYAGRAYYYALTTYYRVRVAFARGHDRRCTQLLCASQWTADCWVRLGFPRERISVIPFSLNLEKFQARPHPPVSPDAPVTFLHLGRIVPRKRLDLLIAAFRLLTLERSGVKLLIIGKFAYAVGYRRLLDPDQVPLGVEYLASVPREQVSQLFETMDVLVQPSENEDFGSAVMEAQGSGVPVVVGPSNGTAEYVGDRSFKFAAYTAESIRDALVRAVDAVRTDRAALTEDSRRAAEKHFRPENVAAKLIAVVREVGGRAQSSSVDITAAQL